MCLCLKRAKSFDLALEIGHVIFKTNTQANLVIKRKKSILRLKKKLFYYNILKIRNTVLFDCIQYLLLQKLKQNKFKDEDGSLLKTFEKTLHMYPGNIWGLNYK